VCYSGCLSTARCFQQLLYSTDVLSDQAILYWYSKGSKPQARQHFLKATEPLVQFLQEQEDESEEEE
jgi:hypothetical protein